MVVIILKLILDGVRLEAKYQTPSEILNDVGLPILFEGGHVSDCEIFLDNQRIAGIPLPNWKRLKDAVASNGATLLRRIS